jgi:transcriptional regulator with XRE-family HTH domain
MVIKKTIGNNVKRARKSKSWSQHMLGERSGLHHTYISDIERGMRNPTIEIIFRIAFALNVNASELFELDETVT